MFLTLLVVTFAIAAVVSLLVARAFRAPIRQILSRLVSSELSAAWQRYITFAIFVVGLSGGVPIYSLEQYINPRGERMPPLVLDRDRWVLEVYRAVIETLKSIAWMLLVFFLVALVAYVILRGLELRAARQREATSPPPAP